MKTGGFSRFARKPGPKESSASGIPHVGGKSEALMEQHITSQSTDGTDTWRSSGLGSGFGFDAALDETSFGGEIQNDGFPVPKPMERNGNIFQNKSIVGAPPMMKSSPAAKMDGGRSLGCSTSAAITSRKIPVPSMSSPPSKLHHPPSALVSHGTVDAPPVITPVPLTKRSDSRAETCTVATEGRRIVSSYEQPRSPVHVSAAHVNSRRVTLEVGGTSKDCESSKISSVTKNFAIVEVTQKQGAQIASPLDKTNGTMSANLQGDYERAINHTGISEDGPSDVLIIASENVSMGGVTVEPNNVDSAVGSFEEMYQSIMSKNLQFEDGWKYFQDKILDLSGELSMKHGDILAIEQSALNLKREMGQKLEALLHQVEF